MTELDTFEVPDPAAQMVSQGISLIKAGKAIRAHRLLHDAIHIARTRGDQELTAEALLAAARNALGYWPERGADHVQMSRQLCCEALEIFRACDNFRGLAQALRLLSVTAPGTERRAYLLESVDIARQHGLVEETACSMGMLAARAALDDDCEAAATFATEAIETARQSGDEVILAETLHSVAVACIWDARYRAKLFDESHQHFRRLGLKSSLGESLLTYAMLTDDSATREKCAREALYIYTGLGNVERSVTARAMLEQIVPHDENE